MNTRKLTEEEMAPLRIASLPTRPTAPTAFGGKGYTASEMKAAFDRLPMLIAERLNALICDIESGEITKLIKSPLSEPDTLHELLASFEDGSILGYINFRGETLLSYLEGIREDVENIKKGLGG